MPTPRRSLPLAFAATGVLAAVAGTAAGHLVAGLLDPATSPVLAVGSTVIDATPTPVKNWAVRSLGTNDKPVLVGSVALVTALLAAGAGLLARRHLRAAGGLLGLLAVLSGLAALVTTPTPTPDDILPALTTVLVGIAVLVGLRRLLPHDPAEPSPVDSPLAHTAHAPGSPGRPLRRSFLLGSAGVGVGALGIGAAGQALAGRGSGPSSVSLPRPATTPAPLPQGLHAAYPGISPFRTPLADFYRVDTALVVPRVDVGSWRLAVDGSVDHPFSLAFEELVSMGLVEKDITLNCVSNEVGGPYVSSARWLGVPARDLLQHAGVQAGVDQILSTSTDGMTISTPVEALMDDRGALVAVGVDGGPLPAERGFPARLITPGLYGYVGATKWLTRLTATTYTADPAYWTTRGWATDAPVKTQTRIDTRQGCTRPTRARSSSAGSRGPRPTSGSPRSRCASTTAPGTTRRAPGPWRSRGGPGTTRPRRRRPCPGRTCAALPGCRSSSGS